MSMVLAKMDEWQCNKIFLATEDKNIVQIFKQIFGDLCSTFDKAYVDYNVEKFITSQRIDRANDYFLQGKEYLIEIVLLAMCNSLVSARCFGSVGAMIIADNFDHTYFFNLGRYGVISLD